MYMEAVCIVVTQQFKAQGLCFVFIQLYAGSDMDLQTVINTVFSHCVIFYHIKVLVKDLTVSENGFSNTKYDLSICRIWVLTSEKQLQFMPGDMQLHAEMACQLPWKIPF